MEAQMGLKKKVEIDAFNHLKSLPEICEIKYTNQSLRCYNGMDVVEHSEMITRKIQNRTEREFIRALAKFISAPVIIDEFSNHQNRRLFRNRLKENNFRAYTLLRSNRLRLNNISRVVGILQFDELFNINSTLQGKLDEIKKQVMAQSGKSLYEKATDKEKAWVAEQVTHIAREAYEAIVANL